MPHERLESNGEDHGPIEEDKPTSALRQTPYNMPKVSGVCLFKMICRSSYTCNRGLHGLIWTLWMKKNAPRYMNY